jgi:prepilin-type N-terminal cleavage/methylation domain-containing protein
LEGLPLVLSVARRVRKGFTLVEILIATAVMSLAAFVVYEIFYSGAKTTAVGMWRSHSTQELRNGLRLIREDLARATYPSKVTDSGTEWPDRDSHHCKIISGRTEAFSDGVVLSFFICSPEVNVGGETQSAAEITHCQLSVEGNKLHYTREGTMKLNKILVNDLEYIDISSEASSDNVEKNTITIEIGTKHPKFERTKVSEKVIAKVEVEVR